MLTSCRAQIAQGSFHQSPSLHPDCHFRNIKREQQDSQPRRESRDKHDEGEQSTMREDYNIGQILAHCMTYECLKIIVPLVIL